jgi:homoserine O-acetyltransferase
MKLYHAALISFIAFGCHVACAAEYPAPHEGDFLIRDFQFKSGERLTEIKIHYATFGALRTEGGRVANAVLLLHSTGGSLRQYLTPNFAGELFGAGQLLDAKKYFIIVPDNIGHGKSSKPSDNLRMRFPHYGYDDMIELQHRLVTEGLHVNHLRLVIGASMGGMHTWMWGEKYPDMMDALLPLASQPIEIAGRNRMWRRTLIDTIRNDPQWKNGNYETQPSSLRSALAMLVIMGSNTQWAQKEMPTREKADAYLEQQVDTRLKTVDANDFLYYIDSSRDYNPEPDLERITVPLTAVNSADDAINPPELGLIDKAIPRVKNGKYVLIPASDQTRGHGTHSYPVFWQQHLAELLDRSEKR